MKFKIGDKVRIRNDLEIDKKYGFCRFVINIAKWKGKIVMIEEKSDKTYKIKDDEHYWTDEMFEDKPKTFKEILE